MDNNILIFSLPNTWGGQGGALSASPALKHFDSLNHPHPSPPQVLGREE